MPAHPVNDPAPALSAFLRGVERRGRVFAHLQAGDAAAGTAALAEAMASFRTVAPRTPFGEWPRRFWAILLAAPQLRGHLEDPRWPEGFEVLGRIGRGPRAALLLRLVAHISEADAAAVLGVGRPAYRMALRRALPRRADGSADAEAWQQLGVAARQEVRDLAPETLSELAQLREAALQGTQWKPQPEPVPADAEQPGRPRWLWPATALVVLATVAALWATTRLAAPAGVAGSGTDGIVSEQLPAAPAAAGTWDEDLALLTHPDFELLAVDAADAAMREPAFHAWLVHRLEIPGSGEAASGDDAAAPEQVPVMPPELQEHAAALPPEEANRMALRHGRMQAMAAEEVAALRRDAEQWAALDVAAQRARRDAWQTWNRLPADARARMRQAAAAWMELPDEEQQSLSQAFAQLDELERNGWRLGPDLGADWPDLHPLFALVPAGQQEELLAVLMSMDAVERADLAVIAQRTPPGERDALRDALLGTPAENRAAWLRGLVD